MVNIGPNIFVNHKNINGLNLPTKRCYLIGFLKKSRYMPLLRNTHKTNSHRQIENKEKIKKTYIIQR